MLIYQIIFGIDAGQVNCCFHDDENASAGIGPNGEYNCFTCGAKAHNHASFIAKYFQVGIKRATRIHTALTRVQKYKYSKNKLEDYQIKFLKSIGLSKTVIDKYFFSSAVGKLIYAHTWNGIDVGYTWFNDPTLPNHNVGAKKYKYDRNNIAGMVTPYDIAQKYNTLVVCEGEKDMLTAQSYGIVNAVAKVGGAATYLIGGHDIENKNIILCYDCDDWGRDGAIKDAINLKERFNCNVKVLDLGLKNKEDLNDYFVKYKHTKEDFFKLIKATEEFTPPPQTKENKLQKFVGSLSDDELDELKNIIKENENE